MKISDLKTDLDFASTGKNALFMCVSCKRREDCFFLWIIVEKISEYVFCGAVRQKKSVCFGVFLNRISVFSNNAPNNVK